MGCCNNFGNQRNQRDRHNRRDRYDRFNRDDSFGRFDGRRGGYNRHGNRPGCRRCPILPGFPRIF